jgi:Uma2 family endonuclease
MAETAERVWTVEAFLARGERPGVREELHGGRIVAMAPPAPTHGTIAMNTGFSIRRRLRPPCRVVVEAPVRIDEATLYAADLAVTCTPPDPRQPCVEPALVVEILSRSTPGFDLGEKAQAYAELPSCREIWLVDNERRRVQLWRRTAEGWTVTLPITGAGRFRSAFLEDEIGLDELYADTGL